MGNESKIALQNLLQAGLKEEQSNNPRDAITLYTKAVNIDPTCEEALTRICNIFLANQEYEKAIKALNYLLACTDKPYYAHFNLGSCYQSIGQFEEAEKSYQAVVDSKPDFRLVFPAYTALLLKLKKVQEAEAFINSSIQKHSNIGDIYWAKAKLAVYKKEYSQACADFATASDLGIVDESLYKFYSEFALAKAKNKEFDDAINLHSKGQLLAQKKFEKIALSTSFTDKTMKKALNGIKDNYQNWSNDAVDDYKDPIFVVGFPRSGTTLLEQILFAHPNLIATDELQVLKDTSQSLSKIVGREIAYTKGWEQLTSNDIVKYRAKYFADMASLIPNYDSTMRIVDKNPLSIVHLSTVLRFFPKSPVVVMIRDPRDVCLSCFIQTFKHNVATKDFYNIRSTFKYYARVMKCYLALKQTLPLNILEIKYEDMCEDFESHAHKLLEHVGEAWDDKILNFYSEENKRFISTPSFSAVFKPVNKGAVGNWKSYEKHLKPHFPIIEPYLNAFNYK